MMDFKTTIDMELKDIYMSDALKQRIRKKAAEKSMPKPVVRVAAAFAILLMCGTTVFAGYYMYNRVMVNEEVLPELDRMYSVTANTQNFASNANDRSVVNFSDYQWLQDAMGLDLLDSELAEAPAECMGTIETDKQDFAIITLESYILGDAANQHIDLTVDIMLSQTQEENGWDVDYLGMYRFKESYVSKQGYRVNIVEDTTDEERVENYVSEKCAIFVVDGIRYTLKGRTSLENIKAIVDTMR